ncbi:DHA2 family efflux MFS transporter permease subunit [Streptomyces sp. WMMC500]|uniref:DHA2 family efflux MFS transporter permease subunit n=1 Tax=Streptomyces sp. WMMC500 TaxID=3015154 RepID=UPI00248CA62B|nr:DHA2 family efflux MFS transporter permease subunit [Streptomyces sp. WMMC500]WBB64151.1 DHA2 family efflux MFS transporter permease subunit [Streptomyces sp. WMMC500]
MTAPTDADPRRWVALAFIGLAQLMIVLDVTIVNIALPSAQADLDISDGDRQWVITAYTLAFGGLLLLGGRIADYTGRRRAFLTGLLGFAAASAVGGAAPNFAALLSARAAQGAFAALLAPAALSLLTTSFTERRERARAFGIFGAIAAGGGAIGLVTGGALTEYLDWRWCLYVNVPIAVVAAAGWWALPADTRTAPRPKIDVPGALLAVTGLVALVYGCSEAESEGWDSALVLGLLFLGTALLTGFVLHERIAAEPLLPLRILISRTRGSAFLSIALATVGMFAMFLFLTYYMQVVMGYSALKTGVGFLPLTAGVLAGAGGLATRLLPRVPPRALIAPGLLFAAAGTGWLATLEIDTSYAAGILPAELVMGLGMGMVMAPAINYATHGVGEDEAGIASATVNTSQQIGGSIGTALLNTVATSTTTDHLTDRLPGPGALEERRAAGGPLPDVVKAGLVEGFASAYAVASALMLAAALVVAALMNTPRPDRTKPPATELTRSDFVHLV